MASKIENFKREITESILQGVEAGLGMKEKTDTPVGAKAGALIAAGAAKVGDAISKMDDAAFQMFAQKIDSAGIDMVLKTFTANGAPAPTQAGATPATPAAPGAGLDAGAAPAAPPVDQELKDL